MQKALRKERLFPFPAPKNSDTIFHGSIDKREISDYNKIASYFSQKKGGTS